MALLREGINLANEYVGQMESASKELTMICNEIENYLNGNENFQLFRSGTEKGQEIYNNLNKCLQAITDNLVPMVERISSATNNLLVQQEQLNRG